MKPRVLLLQHTIYPYRLPLFRQLSDSFELTVCFVTERTPDRRWELPNLARESRFEGVVLDPARPPTFISQALSSLVAERAFDAFVVSGIDRLTIGPAVLLRRKARSLGTPLVLFDEFFETSWYRRQRLKTVLNRVVRRFLYRDFESFALFSKPAMRYVLARGVQPNRIFVGPHWYPLPEPALRGRDVAISRWPVLAGKRVVLCLSYLSERKGVAVLISAFRQLPDKDVALVIAGDGEDRPRLTRLAAGDPRILFVGHVDGEEKDAVYQVADLFVLPTLHDPWGLVVNEAMAYGLPVVTTKAAGSSEDLVEGFGSGLVVPPSDQTALHLAMQRLISDDPARVEMGQKARERIRALRVEDMARPLVAAINMALGRGV